MTLHEQITALLDGELADGPAVAELMHMLSVSPEKRELLVEQIALKRHVASAAALVAPSAAADRAVFAGLAAVDAGAPPGAAGAGAATPGAGAWLGLSRGLTTALALVLLGGIAIGYLMFGARTPRAEGNIAALRSPGAASTASAAAEDSLRSLLADLSAENAAFVSDARNERERVRALEGLIRSEREHSVRLGRELAMLRGGAVGVPDDRSVASTTTVRSLRVDERIPLALAPVAPREHAASATESIVVLSSAGERYGADPSPASHSVDPAVSLLAEEELRTGQVGPWQMGARMNFRHSIPRVYGLAGRRSALFDKEFVGSLLLGGNDNLFSALRLGAAFGETQFSISFHTNEGGALRDSIVELSPTTLYARAFVAPELVRYAGITSGIELGGGYTFEAGGFGSVGLNLEYRPTPAVSAQLGASAWLLLTERASSIYLSTNLNAHIGVAFGF